MEVAKRKREGKGTGWEREKRKGRKMKRRDYFGLSSMVAGKPKFLFSISPK